MAPLVRADVLRRRPNTHLLPPKCFCLLVEARYLAQPQPAGLLRALLVAGHRVEVVVSDRTDPAADVTADRAADVMVARGRSPALLALLRTAEEAGIPTVNRVDAIRAVIDKAGMDRRLREITGVRLPETWLAAGAARLPDLAFPLVVKPRCGDNGRGVRLACDRGELTAAVRNAAVAGEELLAQELVRGDGRDLKLYGVGDRVWAVRRPASVPLGPPPARRPRHGVPWEAEGGLRDLARRCADAFGLQLYGVDCIETSDGPVVIEVNDFPNYGGIPGADRMLAEHVMTRCTRRGAG